MLGFFCLGLDAFGQRYIQNNVPGSNSKNPFDVRPNTYYSNEVKIDPICVRQSFAGYDRDNQALCYYSCTIADWRTYSGEKYGYILDCRRGNCSWVEKLLDTDWKYFLYRTDRVKNYCEL